MARFLFATQPASGHVAPMLDVVRRLVGQGHEVVWYCGRAFQQKIEATGARFAPFVEALELDEDDIEASLPGRSRYKGIAQVRYDLVNGFMKQVGLQHHEIKAILRDFPADVLVGDTTTWAASTVYETGGPVWATFNVICLGLRGRDVAPFGLGMHPSASPLGRLRNRLLYWLTSDVIFGAVNRELHRQRAALGLPPIAFDEGISPFLALQPTVEGFEYPRTDMPPQLHFIGPLLPEVPPDFRPPAWWPEVVYKRHPVVLVTQGTIATDVRNLIAPTIRGLAGEDVLVIAAGVKDAAALGLDRIPDNVRIEPFVPFKPLLPHVDVFVTNGGYGGVNMALANGVPVIGAGNTEDKTEITARIAYSGVGLNLKTNMPSPEQVRQAVWHVLAEQQYRQRARAIKAEMDGHDGPAEAVYLLERLAFTKRPVLRGEVEVRPFRPEAVPAPA